MRKPSIASLTVSVVIGFSLMAPYAVADSISPTSFSATGPTGFTTSVNDTVTVNAAAPLSGLFPAYSSVCLSPVGNAPNVIIAFSPVSGCITGTFDRSIDRAFSFNNLIADLVPGVHSFVINATVDGGTVATQSDTINSTGGAGTVPEPSTWLLLGSGLAGLVLWRRRQRILNLR